MNSLLHFICDIHQSECILFGSSPQCSEKAVVCTSPSCMEQHSLKLNEHNFYGVQDFHEITNALISTFQQTMSMYQNKINELIQAAILQLESYGSKQKALIQQGCLKIFSKVPEEQRAIQKIIKGQFESLKCHEVAFIYQKYANQKQIDYGCLQELQSLVEATMIDVCDNNDVFKLVDKRRSNYVEESEMDENIKKKANISYEDIQNENIRLLVSKWEKLQFAEQEELHQTIKKINWENDEWDLSDGYFLPFEKVLNVSRNIKAKQVNTLKMFNNDIVSLKPLLSCKFQNMMNLFIASNKIQSLEPLSEFQFPLLKKLSIYDNYIISISSLRKADFPKLKVLFLNNNLINDVSSIKEWNYPKMAQLSINHNNLVNEECVLVCQFPKIYYLNLKNKEYVRNGEDKNVKEAIIHKKFSQAVI